MTVRCPGCGTNYQVPEGTAGKEAVRLRCRNCGTVFSPQLPGTIERSEAAPPAEAPEAPVSLDEVVRRVTPVSGGIPAAPVSAERPPSRSAKGKLRRRAAGGGGSSRRRGIPWVGILVTLLVAALLGAGFFGWSSWRRGREIGRFLSANLLVTFGGPEEIGRPAGLAVIPDGRIAVVDRLDHKVKIFSPGGEVVESIGGWGVGDVDLWDPEGLSYAAGKLATFDAGNGYVKVFDLAGSPVAKYPIYNRLYLPRDLALGEDGGIVVADTGNHRLVVVAADGSTMRDIGRRGEGKGELNNPYSVILLSGGRVATVDAGNNRISIFDLGGGFLNGWRYEGVDGVYSITPALGWVRDLSLIVLADPHHRRLQVFEASGRPVGTIAKRPDGRPLFDDGGPIWVDAARPGELAVLTERGRVLIFGY
jgi:predicted Zn finger-like uncharacterized protein